MSVGAIPAATLVLLRDGDTGLEVLIAERAATLAFAGGAIVFPGGRVDPADRVLADGLALARGGAALDEAERAARIAAIRETIEECGIVAGIAGAIDATDWRARLAEGATLAALLRGSGAWLDLAALLPLARWRPPAELRHRFDTRFYLACGSAGAVPVPDGAEIVAARWVSPAALLAQIAAGEARAIFPTRRMIERIARYRNWDEAAADTAAWPDAIVEPAIAHRNGERWLTIPEGLGYPITAERLAETMRD